MFSWSVAIGTADAQGTTSDAAAGEPQSRPGLSNAPGSPPPGDEAGAESQPQPADAPDRSWRAVRQAGAELEVVTVPAKTASIDVFKRARIPFLLNRSAAPISPMPAGWRVFGVCRKSQPSLAGFVFTRIARVLRTNLMKKEFLDSLCAYRGSMEELRQQLGLSDVSEATMIGAEGKVWFITPFDDVWLALFVDRGLDVHASVDHLLAPLHLPEHPGHRRD